MSKILVLILMAILPCAGFESTTKAGAATAHKRPAVLGTAPVATDAVITATIRQKLAKSKIGKNGFTFKVSGGIVTWEGKTDVVQHKGSATRMANTAGARAVINNIKISEAAKAKAAQNLATGRRRAQVTRGEPRTATR